MTGFKIMQIQVNKYIVKVDLIREKVEIGQMKFGFQLTNERFFQKQVNAALICRNKSLAEIDQIDT